MKEISVEIFPPERTLSHDASSQPLELKATYDGSLSKENQALRRQENTTPKGTADSS